MIVQYYSIMHSILDVLFISGINKARHECQIIYTIDYYKQLYECLEDIKMHYNVIPIMYYKTSKI